VLVGVGGGLTVVLMVVELDLVAEDVLVVVIVLVVEEDLLEDEETDVEVVEETVLEDDEPEPEPGLGKVDPISPQRTLLCRAD
jgi:hypothetical protein